MKIPACIENMTVEDVLECVDGADAAAPGLWDFDKMAAIVDVWDRLPRADRRELTRIAIVAEANAAYMAQAIGLA
jgi:hypothetical protein